MKRPLIILAGPTAVGKTAASIHLAKAIGAEVISADSMQVYRHMDIGSAKIRKEEMEGVPHYLIDVLEPEEEFNVVRFQQMAKAAAEEIYAKGKIPLVAGGTGFTSRRFSMILILQRTMGTHPIAGFWKKRRKKREGNISTPCCGKHTRKQRNRSIPTISNG